MKKQTGMYGKWVRRIKLIKYLTVTAVCAGVTGLVFWSVKGKRKRKRVTSNSNNVPIEPPEDDSVMAPAECEEVNSTPEIPAETPEERAEDAAQTPGPEETDGGAGEAAETPPEESDRVTAGKLGRAGPVLVRVLIISAFLLVFIIGMSVMLYPSISNYVNEKNQSRVIGGYKDSISGLSEADYAAYLEAARDYNARLAGAGLAVTDAFSDAGDDTDKTDEYWKLLDAGGSGMMGYIEIERINVELPVYHGTSEAVLAVGVGHIQGSSLPVGGESTHAVMSAHTGLPSAKLFTGIDRMEVGDTFKLYVLNDILTYQVDQILTVLPHEIDALAIVKGGDYVTLVTCTPYGINSHRLLIRGVRIETQTEQDNTANGASDANMTEHKPNWLQRMKDKTVAVFANAFETVAQWLVNVTEWGMDLFGVEY